MEEQLHRALNFLDTAFSNAHRSQRVPQVAIVHMFYLKIAPAIASISDPLETSLGMDESQWLKEFVTQVVVYNNTKIKSIYLLKIICQFQFVSASFWKYKATVYING